tara:strand:- start:367 stop:672 length:306 start_codon:yes stop_codon:yes gene_type:complete
MVGVLRQLSRTEQSHKKMQNIKSPMATPTYRRRRSKREFWNTTKAYANYELRNPSAVSAAKSNTKHIARKKSAVKSVNDWISQMGEDVRVQTFTESKVRYV